MSFAAWRWEIRQHRYGRTGWRLLVIGVLTLLQLAPGSGYGRTIGNADSDLRLPAHLGEVVYQERLDRDNRVYIIAQSHRSAISGKENDDCQQVQAEIYRIGEWLIAHEQVDVILPEGYFDSRSPNPDRQSLRPQGETRSFVKLDDASLASLLGNPTEALSADRLLHRTYDLTLRQVEDREIFMAVADQLRSLLTAPPQEQPDPNARPLLLYQQQKRTAVILENTRGTMAEKRGETDNPAHGRRAILTIGLAHVDTMIDLLNNGKTHIPPPPGMEGRVDGCSCDLTGLKESCAIVVIIPQTLRKVSERLRQHHLPLSRQPEQVLCPPGKT